MRWPLMLRQTNVAEADGEIVRSRSPDAGIKPLAGFLARSDGGQKPGAPRRPRISRQPIAQGTPVVSAALWFLACVKVHSFCTQGSRVRPASGIPCALFASSEGGDRKTRTCMSRERGRVTSCCFSMLFDVRIAKDHQG